MTHEGAQVSVAPDGRVVVFMGDDDDFEYLYRFVTRDKFNPDDRAANKDLLDNGTLSVAKFASDGTMNWIPLVAGQGPLTAEAGFATQADVVLNTRAAADLVGATPMDGPEGFIPHTGTGKHLCRDDRERGPAAGRRGRRGARPSTSPIRADPTRTATCWNWCRRARPKSPTMPPTASPGTCSCCAAIPPKPDDEALLPPRHHRQRLVHRPRQYRRRSRPAASG